MLIVFKNICYVRNSSFVKIQLNLIATETHFCKLLFKKDYKYFFNN